MCDCKGHSWQDDDGEDNENPFIDMTREELEEHVRHSLEYLVAEGVVIQRGKYFRLKTEEEIEQELRDIENGDLDKLL